MTGTNVGTAYLEVVPSARGFAGKLQAQVGGGMAKAGQESGKRYGGGFSKGAKSLIGAGAGFLALSKGIGFFKDANAEARESQKVGARTANVIKTTGGVANISAKQVGNLATALSNKIGVDDEAIQTGANLLLTFKNIRNEAGKGNQIFNRATKAAADLSASGFGDLNGASKQLGKALNDPVKGITALGRSGVTFTDAQKKQIKALVKTNRTLDAQKIILKEVESQVGGSAAAQATAGEKAKVAFDNFKETLGTALLPVIDKVETAAAQFFSELQSGEGTGGKVAAILKKVGTVLGTVFGFLAKHKETVLTFIGVLGALVIAFAAVNAVMAINPISLVVIAIAALVTGLIMAYKHSETFRKVVDVAFHAIAKVIDFAKDHWKLLLILITGPFGAAILGVITHFKTVKSVVQTVFKFIVNAFLTVVGALVNGAAKAFGWVPGIGKKLKAAAKHFNEFKDSVNRALDGIHATKEIHLKVSTQQVVLNPSLNKPRGTGGLPAGATGAIVRRPTLALIGEAGPEALVPLNKTAGNLPLPVGTGGAGQVGKLTITNWEQGTGYFEIVADSRVGARRALDGRKVRAG